VRNDIPVTEQEEAAWREMERRQAQADHQPAGVTGAPERIFLVIGELDGPVRFGDLAEVTWSEDRQFDADIEYVRAQPAAITVPAGEREAFEAWGRTMSGWEGTRNKFGEYTCEAEEFSWRAWQARAALAAPAAPQEPSDTHRIAMEALQYIGGYFCDSDEGDDWHLKHHALHALERIKNAAPAAQAAPTIQDPLMVAAPLTDLHKFYGVENDADLIAAQQHHIEKLQARMSAMPSLAPQRIREG